MLNYDNIKQSNLQPASPGRTTQLYAGRLTFQLQDNRAASLAETNISTTYFTDNRPQFIIQKKLVDAMARGKPERKVMQLKTNKTGLPDSLKSGIENLSGLSLDDVNVHYHSSQPAQLNAHAYAQGTDIHLAPGQEKHLPHEAWHVVQQKQGRVKPTLQLKNSLPVNDDIELEKEADKMGASAMLYNGTVQLAALQKKPLPIVNAIQRIAIKDAFNNGELQPGTKCVINGDRYYARGTVMTYIGREGAKYRFEYRGGQVELGGNVDIEVERNDDDDAMVMEPSGSEEGGFDEKYPAINNWSSSGEEEDDDDHMQMETGPITTLEGLKELTEHKLFFPPPSPDRSYSNSEPASFDEDFRGVHNKTKAKRKEDEPRVDNYLRKNQVPPDLDADAKAIHDMIPPMVTTGKKAGKVNPGFGGTTIVTALFFDKETGRVKKFAFSNMDTMDPYIQKKCEELGYHVITAGVSHAEGELLQYLKGAREKYEFLSIGCDKPHCRECQWAMSQVVPAWTTQSALDPADADLFKQYRMPKPLRKVLGGAKITGPALEEGLPVTRHINKTKKKRKVDEYGELEGDDEVNKGDRMDESD